MQESIGGGKTECQELAKRAKRAASEALKDASFDELFKILEIGGGEADATAEVALKEILADRMAEYTMQSFRYAKKRNAKRVGAAAMIIASAAQNTL